jgi:hypothetical protein
MHTYKMHFFFTKNLFLQNDVMKKKNFMLAQERVMRSAADPRPALGIMAGKGFHRKSSVC